LFFLGALFSEACAAEVVDRILAVVNDEIVTEQDLDIVMAPIVAQYRTVYTGNEYEEKVHEARQEFLGKVMDDKLILGEAKRKQVIVKDEEVDEMMADVRNKFPSRDAFLRAIEDQGLTEKKLWNRFRDQLMTQKLVSYEVKSKVSVSPGEVNEYYKSHSQEFVQGDRVKLQHILIRTSTRSEEEARALAEDILSQLRAGKAFEELARLNSEGAEASDGGEMGWVEKGQLMGEIDEKVFGLEKGQLAGPIQSSLGYHIFKVVERDQFSVKPISEVRSKIQDVLFKEKLRERLESWMKSLKKNAYISIR
jgi:parvulin-like peptidyl-prolyl isomerase